jgi:hypothetical protein
MAWPACVGCTSQVPGWFGTGINKPAAHGLNLTSQRGKTLRLLVEDMVTGSYGYVGTSGFDLITSYNGP